MVLTTKYCVGNMYAKDLLVRSGSIYWGAWGNLHNVVRIQKSNFPLNIRQCHRDHILQLVVTPHRLYAYDFFNDTRKVDTALNHTLFYYAFNRRPKPSVYQQYLLATMDAFSYRDTSPDVKELTTVQAMKQAYNTSMDLGGPIFLYDHKEKAQFLGIITQIDRQFRYLTPAVCLGNTTGHYWLKLRLHPSWFDVIMLIFYHHGLIANTSFVLIYISATIT